jgi:hypothetical protein
MTVSPSVVSSSPARTRAREDLYSTRSPQYFCFRFIWLLKGHVNEADFLGFLQKLVPHRSLTLLIEPFRFWLRIRGDIRNRKKTLRLGESGSRLLNVSKENLASRRVRDSSTRRVGESSTPQLGEPGSRYGVALESLFEFFLIYHQITAL